mgnify:CR=1 FL=1
MIGMVISSIGLFFRGKLFAEPGKAYLQLAIGMIVTAACLLAVSRLGVPLLFSAIGAGFLGGALQPYLFRNLRYR